MTEIRTGRELAHDLELFLNGGTEKAQQDFVAEVMKSHRTLQQNTMRLFMKLVEEWSKTTSFDGRNEATVELAKKIMSIEDRSLPYI